MVGFSTLGYADPLTVKTAQGEVHGKTINEGQVKAFLGIPYAAPPVGNLRWRAPAPPARWKGVRDATAFGAHCAQLHVFDDVLFQDSGPSEDCLFLNVFAPVDARGKNKLPVMFWIHGGGYSVGSSSEPRHDGDFLPLKGVVLVTINYRLGVFGFLATSDLAKEHDGTAGNYGLMDMVAALHWVKANIRNFGGDPDNVTIFGESAGSMAVSALMASPETKGLYGKAIGESGSVFGDTLPLETLAAREKENDDWVKATGAGSLAQLRELPTDKILDAVKVGKGAFSPVIDGKLLTGPPSQTYSSGHQAHVPLLAGWNEDEGSFLGGGMTLAKFQEMAAAKFKSRAPEFLSLFPAGNDQQAVRAEIDYGGDAFIALSTWKWLELHRKTGGAPVYRYHFELAALPSKFHPGTFAFHSDEIEYVFGTLDTRPGWTVRPEDRVLSGQIMGYWTNFAKTGDPNGTGLPNWPQYGREDSLIHLGNPITAGPDTLRARYEFLEQE
jgi:para-nitrobenzyl esterase